MPTGHCFSRKNLAVIFVAMAAFASCATGSRAAALKPAPIDSTAAILQASFEKSAATVSPAVVAISSSMTADVSPAADRAAEMSADALSAFLSKTTRMVGSGFIISADGYILTNDHVIDDSQQLWITTDTGAVYPAVVVGSDPRADVAVLKIPAHKLPFIRLDPTITASRGQWSLAVGNPFGLADSGGMCISVGVVSAIHRSLPRLSQDENRLYGDLIQTTAQINPGNSGGPLLDLSGRVIGINTAVIMPQKKVNGIGFALPITSRLVALIDQLKQGRAIKYGYLGVEVSAANQVQRQQASIVDQKGARVDCVLPNTPAVGVLQPDDIILAVNDIEVVDRATFGRAIADANLDQPVAIRLVRQDQPMCVQARLIPRPMPAAAVNFSNQRLQWAGMVLTNSPVDEGGGLQVVSVRADSPFFERGIREGALIRTIAGHSAPDIIAAQSLVNDLPFVRCELGVDSGLRTASLSLEQ